jgi:HEAT repeat protein
MLAQDTADLPSRMTVAGIAGQRGLTELAPQLRTLAENAPQPALRRTALAALGQLADPVDLAFVKRFIKDSDPLVAAAAKGAEQRLLTAQQNPSPSNP